jgi:hypothetical protein
LLAAEATKLGSGVASRQRGSLDSRLLPLLAAPTSIAPQPGLFLSDTDTAAALFLSTNFSSLPAVSNLTLLPSDGPFALPAYFNSSSCYLTRLSSLYSASLPANSQLRINATETRRGNTAWQNQHEQTRRQWRIDGLAAASNYTAWLSTADSADAAAPKVLWPAIKLRTKSGESFRGRVIRCRS